MQARVTAVYFTSHISCIIVIIYFFKPLKRQPLYSSFIEKENLKLLVYLGSHFTLLDLTLLVQKANYFNLYVRCSSKVLFRIL